MFAIIVNLPKAPESQTMLAILSLIPYISLVYGVRPYASPYLNVMDLVGTSVAMAMSLGGLVLYGGYDSHISKELVRNISMTLHAIIILLYDEVGEAFNLQLFTKADTYRVWMELYAGLHDSNRHNTT